MHKDRERQTDRQTESERQRQTLYVRKWPYAFLTTNLYSDKIFILPPKTM